jgi:hypothetical protein
MLEIPTRYEKRYFVGKIQPFLHQVFPALLLGVSAGYCQRALVAETETITTQMEKTTDQTWSQCMGRLV